MSGAAPDRPWFWEGHVQAVLAEALAHDGWTVQAAADTESKEPGIDLLATRDDRWLAIEVKGYPSTTYEHGEKRGQPKPTQPTNQARQWFSHALLSAMLLRSKRPDAEIALCFPSFGTYERLIQRTRQSLSNLGVGVYLVQEGGAIKETVPRGVRKVALPPSNDTGGSPAPLSHDGGAVASPGGHGASWDVAALHQALDDFEAELVEFRLAPTTVRTYVDRSRNFVRWLDGDFHPRGPNS